MAVAPTPIFDVVRTMLSSSSRLIQGTPPLQVLETLAPSIQEWNNEDGLRGHLMPISSLIPVNGASLPAWRLAEAIQETCSNFSQVTLEWQERALIDGVKVKLDRFIRDSRPPEGPVQAASGVFRTAPGDVSRELIERQMVDTLKLTIAGALHDASNALAVLQSNVPQAQGASARLSTLVDANFHLLPPDVGPLVPQYVGAISKNVGEVNGLLDQIIRLVRRVQNMVNLSQHSPTDLVEIPRLFEDSGIMTRIGQILGDIKSRLAVSSWKLENIFKLSETHGHYVPPDVFEDGMRLLHALKECFDPLQEIVTCILDLFGLLRKVAGGIDGEASEINLHDHLSKKMLGSVMGKWVKLSFDLETDPWPIRAFEIHIWQIVLNIAVNARDAMETAPYLEQRLAVSTRKVSLSARQVEALGAAFIRPAPQPGEHLVLKIEDSGPGIPVQVLSRIFELGVSGKKSSGLGLTVVLKLVRDMGGFIDVDTSTEEPRRTSFSIYFPRFPPVDK